MNEIPLDIGNNKYLSINIVINGLEIIIHKYIIFKNNLASKYPIV